MNESLFFSIVYIWIACAVLIFPLIILVIVPYGRHTTPKWGVMISNRWGWIIMELPALAIFVLFYFTGSAKYHAVNAIFFLFYAGHYFHRTLVFPFQLRTKGKKMPLVIVFMALIFNFINGFLNGYYLGTIAADYTISWLYDPRFISGVIFFLGGMILNISSDNILIHLRKPNEIGYKVPDKGLFRWISCPNLLGEIIEWSGYALMTWSSPGLAFATWTLVNLLPRALHHHRWYQATFSDYPADRKALIPFIL